MRRSVVLAMMIGSAVAFEVMACDAMSMQTAGDLASPSSAQPR